MGMKTLSGYNVSQPGQSKWEGPMSKIPMILGDSIAGYMASGKIEEMNNDFWKTLKAYDEGVKLKKESGSAYDTGERKGEKIKEYDGNQPIFRERDPERSALIRGTADEAERNRSAYQSQSIGELPTMGPPQGALHPSSSLGQMPVTESLGQESPFQPSSVEPQVNSPYQPGASQESGYSQQTKPLDTFTLTAKQLREEIGVPADKVQMMMQHQMKVLAYVSSLPPRIQNRVAPYVDMLEKQQKWLMENYNTESSMITKQLEIVTRAQEKHNDQQFQAGQNKLKISGAENVANIGAKSREEVARINAAARGKPGKMTPADNKRLEDAQILLKTLDRMVAMRKKLEPKLGTWSGMIPKYKQMLGAQDSAEMSEFITTSQTKVPTFLRSALGGRVPQDIIKRYEKVLHRPDSSKEQFEGTINSLRTQTQDVIDSIRGQYQNNENDSGGTNLLDLVE
jgi:hypothetical protein